MRLLRFILRIEDSLFVIWTFESLIVNNIEKVFSEVPRSGQPDLIIILGKFVAKFGGYLEIVKFGQQGSPYHRNLELQTGV